jgi:dienelactone hydrolase
MMARPGHYLTDLGTAALALLDLRHMLREGVLARVYRDPAVEHVLVPGREAGIAADLYLPGACQARGGLVLVPGFTPQGKDDPRIVLLARLVARIGFVVLVPDLPGLRSLQARETDVEGMVDSFRFLAEQATRVRPDRVGLMGISYGAGPTLIAAADPRIAARVDFVLSHGGYFDLVDVIGFVTTGHYAWQGHHGYIPPSPHARGRFLLANLDLVQDQRDQEILGRVSQVLLNGGGDPGVPAGDLSPWGASLLSLLMNGDPTRVRPLVERLDPRVRERITYLSPSRVIDRVRAHLLVIHGREDDFIPYTESLRLAAAAPDPARVHLAITRLVTHVDVVRPGQRRSAKTGTLLGDVWRMFRVVHFAVTRRR